MKKISKSLVFTISLVFAVACSFSTFAINTNTTGIEKKKPNAVKESNTEMIIGKITSINAENVTIEIATRKKKEKNKKSTKSNIKNKKTNYDDKYVLTGESKTFDIASANLGKKPDETKIVDNSKEKSIGIAKTYADYNIGDYIKITVKKATPTIAKKVRSANQGSNVEGHYVGAYKGSYTGKTKIEKESQKDIS